MPTFDTLIFTPSVGGGTTTIDLKVLHTGHEEDADSRLSIQSIPGGNVHYVSIGGPEPVWLRCPVRFYTYNEYLTARGWVGGLDGTFSLTYAEGTFAVILKRLRRYFRKGDMVLANAEFLITE